MSKTYIQRRLRIGEELVSEAAALDHGAVLVVLAEPGAGKTELLDEFGRLLGVTSVRASRFQHQSPVDRRGSALIVDALDEVAKVSQSSVDAIVVRAQEALARQVVFASRSSEWEAARTRWVRDCFGLEPVIVRIEGFDAQEQRALFEANLPGEDFETFQAEAERFDLGPLLGNPQFLLLFAEGYVQNGRRFTSKAQIFQGAVERLAVERGDRLTGQRKPPVAEIVGFASEIFAKLLLSGASGVSVRETLDDLDYPYMQAMAGHGVADAFLPLDTRLFRPAAEQDRHEPVHRIVAEYCAARHLVGRLADPVRPLSARRLLSVIAPNGAVREELRGLLGWIACTGPERIQRAAIDLDPYAVLANGDPSQLSIASRKHLIHAIGSLVETNPGFRRGDHWRRFSVVGFFAEEIAPDVAQLLETTPSHSPLTDLLLELLVDSGGPASLADPARAIMFDADADRHARVSAARAVLRIEGCIDPADVQRLVAEGTPVSLRVVADLLLEAGLDDLSEETFIDLLRAFARMENTRRSLRSESNHMATFYLKAVIGKLSADQAARYLDVLTDGLACSCGRSEWDCRCRIGLSKVAGRLLDRYFEALSEPIDPDRLWSWLRLLWYENRGDADKSAAIKTLANDDALRHALHRRAFGERAGSEEAWSTRWRLSDGHHHAGLAFRTGDAERMADHAFELGDPDLWIGFWQRPLDHSEARGPDPFRRHLREQAARRPEFLGRWANAERSFRVQRGATPRRWSGAIADAAVRVPCTCSELTENQCARRLSCIDKSAYRFHYPRRLCTSRTTWSWPGERCGNGI